MYKKNHLRCMLLKKCVVNYDQTQISFFKLNYNYIPKAKDIMTQKSNVIETKFSVFFTS